jgi:hypothetical protein
LRLRRRLTVTSLLRSASARGASTRRSIPTVGRRPDRRHRRQLAGGHEASSSDGTGRGSRRIAFEPPPHPAAAVINTAGDTNAGGRHPNANMKGIGRLFGHRYPRGGLHLHHYKQQFFSKQKIFFFPSKGRVCYGIPQQFRIHLFQIQDPLQIVRPITQFHQTHQSISSDPSINFIRTINFVRTISLIRTRSQFCEPIIFSFHFKNLDSPLSIFESV